MIKNKAAWYKKVSISDLEQEVPEDDSQGSTQGSAGGSSAAKQQAQLPLANQQIKCVIPMTFSQKFYQSHELEIAEEFEQALAANSIEKIKTLLDKILELDD